MLQWARANGCPWDEMVTYEAAGRGDLKMIRWSVEQGAPCDTNELPILWEYRAPASNAFNSSHCDWAYGCTWHEDVCGTAVSEGLFEMLKWAREWVSLPDFVCTSAAYYRNVEILEWIRENGGHWDKATCGCGWRRPPWSPEVVENKVATGTVCWSATLPRNTQRKKAKIKGL